MMVVFKPCCDATFGGSHQFFCLSLWVITLASTQPAFSSPESASPPAKEALLAVTALEWLLLEHFQVFEYVAQRVAVVRSFAVSALAYATGMILVSAVRTGKQSWIPAGSFAMAVWAFRWIVFGERRRDAEGLVAANWTTLACVGGRAVEELALILLALLPLLRKRRVRIGGISRRRLWRSFSTTQRRSVDVHGRLALFFLGRITMAGERRGPVFLSVAESAFSVAGDDIDPLCLGEVQSTRYEDLLHSALYVLVCQVKSSFEEALQGSGAFDKLADELGGLVFQLGKLVLWYVSSG